MYTQTRCHHTAGSAAPPHCRSRDAPTRVGGCRKPLCTSASAGHRLVQLCGRSPCAPVGFVLPPYTPLAASLPGVPEFAYSAFLGQCRLCWLQDPGTHCVSSPGLRRMAIAMGVGPQLVWGRGVGGAKDWCPPACYPQTAPWPCLRLSLAMTKPGGLLGLAGGSTKS